MSETRYITAGRCIDGSGSDIHKNVVLTVSNGIITAVTPQTEHTPEPNDDTEDLSHCTLLPALVDCSLNLAGLPSIELVPTELDNRMNSGIRSVVERHVQYCHAHGVLGAADCSGLSDLERYTGNTGTEAAMVAIRTSNPCQGQQDCGENGHNAHDFVKITYCPDIEATNPFHPNLDHEELRVIIKCSGEKKCVVTANGPEQVKQAIAAGCNAIEQGYRMGEDNLREMAAKNILWIPSVVRVKNALDSSGSGGSVCCRFSLRYVAPGKSNPGDEKYWKQMLTDQLGQLRLARELGVPIATGTGAGSMGILHGESMSEEIRLFLKAGFSIEETIQCASETGARFFAMHQLGRLTIGSRATFLIVRGTIKQLPRKLSYLEGMYMNGKPCPAYSKMPRG